MATITNAFTTQTAVGNREDLIDKIYNVDPMNTPFISMIAGRNKATATLHEWQTDNYDKTAGTAGEPEGNETAREARNPTTRLNNVCQINSRNATVSGTQEAVNKAGRSKEMGYQMAKASKELKVIMERVLLGNQIKDANDPRQAAGIATWLTTNTSRGVGGADGGLGATAATDGTQRPITEALLDDVLELCWLNSTNSSFTFLCGSKAKREVATFPGRAGTQVNVKKVEAVNSVDIYKGPLGDVKVVPTRFGRPRDGLVLNDPMVKVSTLRSMQAGRLAIIGDARTREIRSEFTLEMCNEASHGVVADLDT